MATTKKTTKKTVRKTKTVPADALVLENKEVWAVVERRLFTPRIHNAYVTYEEAAFWADHMNTQSKLSFDKYVVRCVTVYDKA